MARKLKNDRLEDLYEGQIGWTGTAFKVIAPPYQAGKWKQLGYKFEKKTGAFASASLLTALLSPQDKLTVKAHDYLQNKLTENKQWRAHYSYAQGSDRHFPVPHGITARPYQNAGTAAIVDTPHILLADDCGLGKTIQAIMAINALPDLQRVIIMCPPHLVLNWRKEWNLFGVRPDLPYIDCADALKKSKYKSADRREPLPNGKGIYVVSYSTVWRPKMAWLKKISWGMCVLDEAQEIKTPTSSRTKGAVRLLKKCKRRVLLTATPILNRPVELYHLVKHIGWKDEYYLYTRRYCEGKRTRFGYEAKGAARLDELNKRLRAGFMVRRAIGDVIKDLPKVTRDIIVLGREGYTKEIKSEWEALRNKGVTPDSIADTVLTLDVEDNQWGSAGELALARKIMALAKVSDVVNFTAPLVTPDDPVIVFGHHIDSLQNIAAGLEKHALRVATIQGGMSREAKQTVVDDFQAGKIDVLVANIKAAGTGLTLTRSRIVVYAELDWTPGNMEQCDGRVIRLTQERPVFIYQVVVDTSIDALIAKTLMKKTNNINAVLA